MLMGVKSMRIAVVGSGYVGLVAGACFADMGHEVILVDNDQQKLAALRGGQVPIHERFLPELLQRHRGKKLRFSDNLHEAARASTAIFVAVGTPPTNSGDADLSYVESVAREISGGIDGYKIVVEKSTILYPSIPPEISRATDSTYDRSASPLLVGGVPTATKMAVLALAASCRLSENRSFFPRCRCSSSGKKRS